MGWEAKIHPPHCHPPPSQEGVGPSWIDKSLLSSWGLRTSVLEWVYVGCTTVPIIIAAAVVLNTAELIYITACSYTLQSSFQLFGTPWAADHQAPLSTGFSRQEYWSGLPFPPPGNIPDPGIEPGSPALAGRFFTAKPFQKPHFPNACMQFLRASLFTYYGTQSLGLCYINIS